MRLLTLLSPALLAATAIATETIDPSTPSTASVSDATTTSGSESSSGSPASSSSSSASSASSTAEPIPIGQLWTAQWKEADLAPYTKKCHSTTTFKSQIYSLKEMYPTLKTWAAELKVFYHRQHYPGSWEGIDEHGDKRDLLKMGLEELPFAVREWLKKNPKQKRFSVQEDVVFFAPGAIYPIAPLWVDEADGSECEGLFEDLDNYSATVEDGKVLSRVTHKKTDKNEVEITVETFQVTKSAVKEKDEL